MEKIIFGIKSYRSHLKDLLLIVIFHDQGHLPDREWEEKFFTYFKACQCQPRMLFVKSILPSDLPPVPKAGAGGAAIPIY